MVHPIVLGTGKKLFRDGADAGKLELIDSKATTKGVRLLRYRPTAYAAPFVAFANGRGGNAEFRVQFAIQRPAHARIVLALPT